MVKRMSKPVSDPRESDGIDEVQERYLILHNDEIHSFDYVIQALVEICEHQQEQAEQCALITHFKGQCDVKKGPLPMLRSKKTALSQRGLRVTID